MLLPFPPPAQGLVTGALMYWVARHLTLFPISFAGQSQLSMVIIGSGLLIELVAIWAFVQAKTTVNPIQPDRATELVTGGLYSISRNPMYLGLAILLTGWMLWLGDLANLLILAGFIALITVLQIKPEESVLQQKFGADYDAYRQKVRRWI